MMYAALMMLLLVLSSFRSARPAPVRHVAPKLSPPNEKVDWQPGSVPLMQSDAAQCQALQDAQ